MTKMAETRKAGVVGQNVLRLRQAKGWSQTELAKKAGLSRGAVANLEIGVSRSPDEDTVEGLAKALETTVADLWKKPVEEARPATQPAMSGPADTMSLETFLERHREDVTEREQRFLEELRNMPGSMLTGSEADWLRLIEHHRQNWAPRS